MDWIIIPENSHSPRRERGGQYRKQRGAYNPKWADVLFAQGALVTALGRVLPPDIIQIGITSVCWVMISGTGSCAGAATYSVETS